MRYRSGSERGPERNTEGRDVELVRVRRTQRVTGDAGGIVRARSRRRGGRGRRRVRPPLAVAPPRKSFWNWVRSLFTAPRREPTREQTLGAQESRVLAEFWQFLRQEKKYWLVPIVIVFVLFGLLMVFSQSSAVAPFIYTLF